MFRLIFFFVLVSIRIYLFLFHQDLLVSRRWCWWSMWCLGKVSSNHKLMNQNFEKIDFLFFLTKLNFNIVKYQPLNSAVVNVDRCCQQMHIFDCYTFFLIDSVDSWRLTLIDAQKVSSCPRLCYINLNANLVTSNVDWIF